ncbi:MAG TPA: cytochrome c3 family protein [Ramlibacter sp.]
MQRPSSTAAPPRPGLACLCAGVSFAELDEAVAADRGATVESLGATLGCGIQCGSCVPALREALGEDAWYAATATGKPITSARDQAGRQRLIYRLDIAIGEGRPYPKVLPGQHVVVRGDTGQGVVERTYTVIAQDLAAGRLSVAIRRKPGGRLTPWLLSGDAPQRHIEVSVPGGPGLRSAGTRSVVFFAGGVGITPAVAMANALASGATMHLEYSVKDRDDAAFLARFEARQNERPNFSFTLRETSAQGAITRRDVASVVERFRDSRFYICGPEGFVATVQRALRKSGIEPARIHVELFALGTARTPLLTPRARSYFAGATLAMAPLLLLSPGLEAMRPHGQANVGHEQLRCDACHGEAPGTLRQVLQAKARHAAGLRETGAVLGMQPVTSGTCLSCHANPDDRHAPNRFLEPRFEKARAETGAQLCVSCHREHGGVRVTAPSAGYCASCHQDTKVKDDPTSPTHERLIAGAQWGACLQCHDYHGNHKAQPPQRLQDAATPEALQDYLGRGPSPYGPTIVKAKKGEGS